MSRSQFSLIRYPANRNVSIDSRTGYHGKD